MKFPELVPPDEPRSFNPLDKISTKDTLDVDSAFDKTANKKVSDRLYVCMTVSYIYQSYPAESVRFIITYLGLNPVYTKGPSALALPAYEPKAEYPGTAAKQ